MKYNPIDNQQSAAILYWQLRMEESDLADTIEYAYGACKATPEEMESEETSLTNIRLIINELYKYAGKEAIAREMKR